MIFFTFSKWLLIQHSISTTFNSPKMYFGEIYLFQNSPVQPLVVTCVQRTLLGCGTMGKWESKCLSCIEKQEGPTPVTQKRVHKFPIDEWEPNKETWIAPQELPRTSVVPGMHKTQKTTINQGNAVLEYATNYLLRQLASTRAVVFHRDSDPQLQVLSVSFWPLSHSGRGCNGRWVGGRAKLVTTLPWLTILLHTFHTAGKYPVSHLRWPSGLDTNKTISRLGSFLHIRS